MKVLVVSQYFWPESFRVNDLALGLVERGHEVTVLTGQPNYETGRFAHGYRAFRPLRERYGGVTVIRMPLVSRGPGTGVRLAVNYLSFALSASVLAPFRLRERHDVTLVYQMSPFIMAAPAFVLKRFRGTPVVFWIQDQWPETLRATGKVRSKAILGALRRLVARMYRASERVLVQSEAFRPAVIDAGVPPTSIDYLPNWAESVYQPSDVPATASQERELPQGFRVMLAGNIGVAQALPTVIEAARQLASVEDLQWVVVGDGRRRQWMRDRVAELGLSDRFCFIDRRPVEMMPSYFALADVLLVTLAADPVYSLTIPSRLQSYLACGRPVAGALDGEGARVIEESEAGLVCPAEDAGGLADTVMELRNATPTERQAMGRRGRAYFERHFEREMLITRLEGHLRAGAVRSPRR